MTQPAIRPTRFSELGYTMVSPDLWRLVDMKTRSHIGAHYRSKAELMGDLDRYASIFGCQGSPLVYLTKEQVQRIKDALHQTSDFVIAYQAGVRECRIRGARSGDLPACDRRLPETIGLAVRALEGG